MIFLLFFMLVTMAKFISKVINVSEEHVHDSIPVYTIR